MWNIKPNELFAISREEKKCCIELYAEDEVSRIKGIGLMLDKYSKIK